VSNVESTANNDYLLLSVQRTGTRFVQRLLTDAGIKTAQIHAVATREKQIEGWLSRNEAEDLPIIVPLRHPFSVAHSWLIRGDILENMFEQWRQLILFCERSRVLFLPVDCHDQRNDYLAEMSAGVGKVLKTDWKPHGHKVGTEYMTQFNRERIALLLKNSFFSKFYNGDVPHETWRGDHD